MKKLMIIMNLISVMLFAAILSRVNIPSPSITGFATAVSSSSFDFQPFFILAFLIVFVTIILNIYFLFSR